MARLNYSMVVNHKNRFVTWPKLLSVDAEAIEHIYAKTHTAFAHWVTSQGLPPRYNELLSNYYIPLAWAVVQKWRQRGSEPMVVGIQGAQGSGKSTTAAGLALVLALGWELGTQSLSLDDFYLSKQRRKTLARTVHGLFETRGVPGTHDIDLALQLFSWLESGEEPFSIPRFDKAVDDVVPQSQWERWEPGSVDILMFEGWCLGFEGQAMAELVQPVNELEATMDPEAQWRTTVNHHLAGEYQSLFDGIHLLISLQVPSFEQVLQWRELQEKKLAEASNGQGSAVMDPGQLRRFVSFFERLTCAHLDRDLERAALAVTIDQDHMPREIRFGPAARNLVVSDLDGSFLNHHSYDYSPCLPVVNQLNAMNIPLVFNTSKTGAELEPLVAELGLDRIHGVENGGALVHGIGGEVQVLGPPVAEMVQWLYSWASDHGLNLEGFSRWSEGEVAQRTGLSIDHAARAKKRLSSEPFVFIDPGQPSESQIESLRAAARDHGYTLTKGGRFYHLMGRVNKRMALSTMVRLLDGPRAVHFVVGVGDSPNDIPMVELAHVSVVMVHEDGPHIGPGDCAHMLPQLVFSSSPAPQGFADIMKQLFTE